MLRTPLTIPRSTFPDPILYELSESEEVNDPLGQAHRLLLRHFDPEYPPLAHPHQRPVPAAARRGPHDLPGRRGSPEPLPVQAEWRHVGGWRGVPKYPGRVVFQCFI